MSARSPINVVDLTSPEFIADPYPTYARLRTDLPVCWDEKLGYWVISRYEDIHPLLRDKQWSSNQLDERRCPNKDRPNTAENCQDQSLRSSRD